MDDRLNRLVETYFRTLNDRDEAAHAALYEPDVSYFGSVSGLRDTGTGLIRGVFRAAWSTYGVRQCLPRKVFGEWPEVAVLVEIMGGSESGPVTEGIWHMVLSERGRIQSLSILWDWTPLRRLIS